MAETNSSPQAGARSLSFKGKCVAFLLGLALAVGCAEIALRLVWHNSYAGASPNFIFTLRLESAGRDYIVKRHEIDADIPVVRYRTDNRSYILPSFQHDKPDATVAFLGGSTTAEVAVQEPLRFHALVSDLLGENGLKVNTLNAARPGNTMHDTLNIFVNHVSADKPDIAVVMNVTNDIGVLAGEGSYRSRMSRLPSLVDSLGWISQVASSHSYIVGALRHEFSGTRNRPSDPVALKWRNDPARADKLPIEMYEKRLRSVIHTCRDFGVEPVLMTEPLVFSTSTYTPDWANLGAQDRFNSLVIKVGEEENVVVIDLVKYLHDTVPNWDEEMVVFYDGMHVTDAGSKIYAKYIAERLEPEVRKIIAARAEQSR